MGSMSVGPLSPGTRQRLLQGQAGSLPAPFSSSSVAIFISSAISGKGRLGTRDKETLLMVAMPHGVLQEMCVNTDRLATHIRTLVRGPPGSSAFFFII